MFYNQIQDVQQKLNSIQQVVGQMRQSEYSNQQKLQHVAQEEARAAQQLQNVYQICQECISNLQSISYGQQQPYTGMTQNPTFAAGPQFNVGQTGVAGRFTPQGSGLFDPTTLSASTYQNTMQSFGANLGSPVGQQFGIQGGGAQMGQLSTGSQLSEIATMGPDTYLASRQQLGKGQTNLSQIGQEVGVSTGMINPQVTNFGGSQLSNISTMDPSTYEHSQQRLQGASPNLSNIGQQAGITGTKGFNQ